MKKLLLICLISFLGSQFINAQTLIAGDIAFVGYQTDSPESFTFITLADIPAGEVIYFTDQGWNGSAWIANTEDHMTWTAPGGGTPCGTVVNITESSADVLTTTGGGSTVLVGGYTGFSICCGDQIIAYQSSTGAAPASPTFIAAVHGDYNAANYNAGTTWNQTFLATSDSDVPTGLTNGVNCVSLFPAIAELDNGKYNGSLTGTSTVLRALINDPTNWTTNNALGLDISVAGYSSSVTCAAPCTDPTVPTVSASPNTICSGSTTTLSITGTLNDATAWHVYTTSCGGTSVGTTTTGIFVTAALTGNTTFFVRGEGGCVTPGTCGSTAVTVNPIPSTPTISAGGATTFCTGGSVTLTSSSATGNQWSLNGTPIGGATNQTYAATASGNYTTIVTTTECASSASSATGVVVNTASSITSATASTNDICVSTSVNVTANGASAGTGATLTWYTGAGGTGSNLGGSNPLAVSPATTTTYYARLDGTCNAVETSVTITVFLPLNVNVTQSGPLLTADEPGATYQWLDCPGMTPISGAINQSYTVTMNGDYAVVVTKNGCSDTSICYTVTTLGNMENNFSNKLRLYPNPTDGNFSIDLGNNYQSTTITITNLNGKIIQSKKYKDSQLLNLKLEESTGVYLLIIESGNKKAIIRLIKE